MQGSGNDFVLIDHRRPFLAEAERVGLVKKVCAPKFGVGADGLIFIESSSKVDFRWRFFNADGSEAEMCGNGGRCAARFAFLNGIAPENMAFETLAGIIHAEVRGRLVKLELSRPHSLELNLEIGLPEESWTGHFINTGVPHVVLSVEDLDTAPVERVGRAVRFHNLFQPAGTNVNFIKLTGPQELRVRTYERGVEAETLACGTGSVAAALIASRLHALHSPLVVHPSSGETMTIYFEHHKGNFQSVYLEGEAAVVFQGKIWLDEL
jgi:diaminopimelate epimerase